MRIEATDIRKSPVASRMDFKRWPAISKGAGYLRVEWLHWIWELQW